MMIAAMMAIMVNRIDMIAQTLVKVELRIGLFVEIFTS